MAFGIMTPPREIYLGLAQSGRRLGSARRLQPFSVFRRIKDRTDCGIEDERIATGRAGLVFCSVPIEDFNRVQLQTCLPDCVAALERMLKQGHSVYVHCSAGVTVRQLWSQPICIGAWDTNSCRRSSICMSAVAACRMPGRSREPAGRALLDRMAETTLRATG